jgi:uncharacterized protein YbaR (Trm112 family)
MIRRVPVILAKELLDQQLRYCQLLNLKKIYTSPDFLEKVGLRVMIHPERLAKKGTDGLAFLEMLAQKLQGPLVETLACPQCRSALSFVEDGLTCRSCEASVELLDHCVRFLPSSASCRGPLASPEGRHMQDHYSKNERARRWLKWISSEFFPDRRWRRVREHIMTLRPLLILGSGVSHYEGAVHLDIEAFPGVEVVADGAALPFQSSVFAAVICEVVLEHVADPQRVVAEIERVLRPGGRAFFLLPFLFPFHGHPSDYSRWTRTGLATLFSKFAHHEVGIHGGPSTALVNILSDYAYVFTGLTFPKGYFWIKGAATAALMPLKFLDLWVNRLPESHRLAGTFFIEVIKEPSDVQHQ